MNNGLVKEKEEMTAGESRRKTISRKKSVRTASLLAIALFVAVLVALYMLGLRYDTAKLENGESILFIGFVRNGNWATGKIMYSSGLTGNVSVVKYTESVDGAEITAETQVIEYSNGTRYTGEIGRDYLKNGEGMLEFASGNIYEGEFKSDAMTGNGTIHFLAGGKTMDDPHDYYEGDFIDGKKQGEGTYTWADGSTYTGGFENDMRHGHGLYEDADGSSYEGAYENGMKQGEGKATYSDGSRYEGTFENDMRHGHGTYTWPNGESYTGEFKNNNISGRGTYTWPSGRTYTGLFENGIMITE